MSFQICFVLVSLLEGIWGCWRTLLHVDRSRDYTNHRIIRQPSTSYSHKTQPKSSNVGRTLCLHLGFHHSVKRWLTPAPPVRFKSLSLLTVRIFLNNFHQVSSVQIYLMFGRLGEVCDHSVGVQYDGTRNLCKVKQSLLICTNIIYRKLIWTISK